MKTKALCGLLIGFIFILANCKDDLKPIQSEYYTYFDLTIPEHFPIITVPPDNPMIRERVELGRYLYYSPNLSEGGPFEGKACANCHLQSKSFTNTSVPAILPHVNLGWNKSFLWNGKIEGSVEDIMIFEVRDFFKADLSLLSKHADFMELYKKAFQTDVITLENTSKAMAQFFRTLNSVNSKFDRYLAGKDTFTASEMSGYQIFNSERGDCFHCHSVPLFTDNSFHNIGLEVKFANHLGRYEVTQLSADVGSYKTPTLRNIAQTGPYMHDDRFTTLTQVVEHYNSGVKTSPVLDPILTKPGKENGLHLSAQEIADVVAYLNTLTDQDFLTNPALKSPF